MQWQCAAWQFICTRWCAAIRHDEVSTNHTQVPLWCQRSGDADRDGLVVWDYHVIMVEMGSQAREGRVWDLDTTLPFPTPLSQYATEALRSHQTLAPRFSRWMPGSMGIPVAWTIITYIFSSSRRYRVVNGQDYLTYFASDRSHMVLEGGRWSAPPPVYPCIVAADGCTNNIDRWG